MGLKHLYCLWHSLATAKPSVTGEKKKRYSEVFRALHTIIKTRRILSTKNKWAAKVATEKEQSVHSQLYSSNREKTMPLHVMPWLHSSMGMPGC